LNMNHEPGPRRFAVLLAAHNGTSHILAQIESILQQSGVDVQLFVSVDKSTDGTEDLLLELAQSERRITLLPFGERFGAAAPNFYRLLRAVDLADFDFLSFADQDDIWHPAKLLRAERLLAEQHASGYSSNFNAFWPDGRVRPINKAYPQRAWDFLFESAGPGCTYVLEKVLAVQLQHVVRGAGASLLTIDYHDWLAYAFARWHGFRWVIDTRSGLDYRQHAHNQLGANVGWRSFVFRVNRILRGYGFQQSRAIADVVGAGHVPIVTLGLQRGRLGYLWLSLRAAHCRRKRIDQLWFFVSCVLCSVLRPAAS